MGIEVCVPGGQPAACVSTYICICIYARATLRAGIGVRKHAGHLGRGCGVCSVYINVAVLQVVPTRVHPSVRCRVGDLFAGGGIDLLVAGLVCRLSSFQPAGQEAGLSLGPHPPRPP